MLGALAALAKDNPDIATLLAKPSFDSAGDGEYISFHDLPVLW